MMNIFRSGQNGRLMFCRKSQPKIPAYASLLSLILAHLSYLVLISGMLFAPDTHAAEPQKVVLFVRELRSESGEILPLRDNVRNVLTYFERQLHIQFEIHRYPLTRILAYTKNGEGLVFGLSKNRERLSQLVFSEAIYANTVWMITRSDNTFNFDSITDLKGKTIGIVRGASYGDDFDKQSNVLFKVEDDVSSHSSRLKKLLNKRMDIMLLSTSFTQAADVENHLRQELRAEGQTDEQTIQSGFVVLNKPLMSDDLHFAVAPGAGEVWINKLNQAIINGRKSGEIARLINAVKK
ncbi:substrate-binding periplasmic protein [Undibacterium sp. Ji67W]|uniref:substrate-binding periplasmic protein n=1 Tax=Undibacterium sp. Ji67W TaxID=3413042 RepID=UPI003BF384DD